MNEAAWNGHIDIVQLLIKNEANVNPVPLGRRRTPLRCAAEQGHTHIVELLLSSNVDVNTQSPPGEWTALHAAAMSGNTETVALLLEHKSDINAKSVNGQTALQMAVQSGNKATVQLLLLHNAKISENEIELQIAANHGFSEIAMLITGKRAAAKAREAKWARKRTDLLFLLLAVILPHVLSDRGSRVSENAAQISLPTWSPLRLARLLISRLKTVASRDPGWAVSFVVATLSLRMRTKPQPIQA